MTNLGKRREDNRCRLIGDVRRAILASAGERAMAAPAEGQAIASNHYNISAQVIGALRAHWRVSPRRAA